jgi:hypothetical protein
VGVVAVSVVPGAGVDTLALLFPALIVDVDDPSDEAWDSSTVLVSDLAADWPAGPVALEPAGSDDRVCDDFPADGSARVADPDPAVAEVDALVAAVVGALVVRSGGVDGPTGVLVGLTGFVVGSTGVPVGPTGVRVDSTGVPVGATGVLVGERSGDRDDVAEGRGVGSEGPFAPHEQSRTTDATATREAAARPDLDQAMGTPQQRRGNAEVNGLPRAMIAVGPRVRLTRNEWRAASPSAEHPGDRGTPLDKLTPHPAPPWNRSEASRRARAQLPSRTATNPGCDRLH